MKIFTLLLLIFTANLCFGQEHTSPYSINWRKEAVHFAIGGATAGIGFHLRGETSIFTPNELTTLDPLDVNAFDRLAIDLESPWADQFSDVLLVGATLTPALLLAARGPRQDFLKIGVMYGEMFMISGGLSHLSKFAFRRPRPYVFNSTADISSKQKLNARTAFVSGHTSQTAASMFFAAKVFSDYYPESKWKPVVWATAATVPAVVGYLRVRAGRHFPTDVLAGYALGAAVGVLVPQLHKIHGSTNGRLSFYPGASGGLLVWNFQRAAKQG